MLLKIKKVLKRQPLWYKLADSRFYQKMMNRKIYLKYLQETFFYKSILGLGNKLIFDVGAHVGTKTKIFSKLATKVVSFEPGLENINILKARLKSDSNCVVHGCALGSTENVASYYFIENDSAYSSLSLKHLDTVVKHRNILDKEKGFAQLKVQTYTLDFFIKEYGIPDYIKIDVEGFEQEVLLGLSVSPPLLSFEANLPEFSTETVQIIRYLDLLSKGRYIYNYLVKDGFELSVCITAIEMIDKVKLMTIKSIEVYCKLGEYLQ